MRISIHQVSHRYGKKLALDRLSLSLDPGFNLLLGPNGAGKSTLFAMLTGLLPPMAGQIHFNGRPLSRHRTAIMSQIGVVFQQNTLDIDLSVGQNLAYFASLHGLDAKPAIRQLAPLLTQLDLDNKLSTPVRQLNGGHRRRVELARCLIHQPSVLLLDEPTVGLDIASRKLIHQLVHQLAQSESMTVLWATHLFEEVGDQDTLVLLDDGKLAGLGRCDTLLSLHHAVDIQTLWRQLFEEAS